MDWEAEEEQGEGLEDSEWEWVDDIPTPVDLANWLHLTVW